MLNWGKWHLTRRRPYSRGLLRDCENWWIVCSTRLDLDTSHQTFHQIENTWYLCHPVSAVSIGWLLKLGRKLNESLTWNCWFWGNGELFIWLVMKPLISNVIHSTPFCFSCGFYLWSKSSFKYFSVHLLVVGATKYRCRHGDLQMWQPAGADTPLDTQCGSGKHSTISKCLFFSEMKYIFLASLPPKCSPKMLVLCLLHFFWWFKKSLLHFTAFENTFGNVLEKLSSARARGILDTG